MCVILQERDRRRKQEQDEQRAIDRKLEREEKEREEAERLEREETERRARDEREWKDRKERERKDREERERKKRELEEARRRTEEEQQERIWREERERRKREADELFGKQKRDREDQERREREDKERREREERERRARDEREKMERERREQEERERERRVREANERARIDSAERARQQQKEDLLARMRAIDAEKQQSDVETELFSLSKDKTVTKDSNDSFLHSTKSRKEWNFPPPVENMHLGKPAYDHVDVPHRKKSFSLFDETDSDGSGYKPSFTSTANATHNSRKRTPAKAPSSNGIAPQSPRSRPKDKKRELMSELFGREDSFSLNTGSSPSKKPHAELEFSFSSNRLKKPQARVDNKSYSRVVGDSPPEAAQINNNNSLLPRRIKQPNATLQSRHPGAANDDDDIEEVLL